MRITDWICQKNTQFGVVMSLDDSSLSELMGMVGFDFVWIDGEHGPYNNTSIQNHIIAARAGNIISMVRIPVNSPDIVKPILEMGPDAVIFPMINSSKEAEQAVSACIYPPNGIRGFGPRRANNYGLMKDYIETYKENQWKIMQIEHIDAVNNLDEILSVQGIDALLVGPFDLSASMKIIGRTRSPEIINVYDEIAEKCNAAGMIFGAFASDADSIKDWKKRGAKFIAIATDTGLIVSAANSILKNNE